jgi:sugar lactone lactonase YvrE
VLLDGQDDPFGILVWDGVVYFTTSVENGRLQAIDLASDTYSVLAAGLNQPRWLATDGDQVYWTNFGGGASPSVMAVHVDGGGPFAVSTSNQVGVSGITVSESKIYWTDTLAGAVMRYGKGGGPLHVFQSGLEQPSAVVPHAHGACWTALEGSVSCSDPTGPALHVAEGQAAPFRLAADETHLYWTNRDGGQVMRGPLPGHPGSVETLAAGGQSPFDLAIDATHVYWTDLDAGTVQRVLKQGGTVELIAEGQGQPAGIAVDASAVYWVNRAGQIMSRAL